MQNLTYKSFNFYNGSYSDRILMYALDFYDPSLFINSKIRGIARNFYGGGDATNSVEEREKRERETWGGLNPLKKNPPWYTTTEDGTLMPKRVVVGT
jgi:hypothetical protein